MAFEHVLLISLKLSVLNYPLTRRVPYYVKCKPHQIRELILCGANDHPYMGLIKKLKFHFEHSSEYQIQNEIKAEYHTKWHYLCTKNP